jgi:hypothetical protein
LNEANLIPNTDEGLFERWSRRKLAEHDSTVEPVDLSDYDTASPAPIEEVVPEPDVDLPPVETLDEKSDVSGFLSPKVSGELRKLALNKLFHLPKFNITDGLDDYDDNYRNFAALGDIITADMRFQIERAAEKAKQALLDEESNNLTNQAGNSEADDPERVIDTVDYVHRDGDVNSEKSGDSV